ncbi:MAG: hypothetical protein FJW37_14070 [Acidobacteria bacterium]|nr:hypothetical protein [Acidobacteriota bacterium]
MLPEAVREITRLITSSVPRSVQLDLDLAPGLPQIQQLIMNLVINAAEAHGESPGRVRISTSLKLVDEDYLRRIPQFHLAPGAYVCLRVTDAGSGMDEATLAKIFDPFFTTKSAGRGPGLAAAHGTARARALRLRSPAGG